METKIQKWGNSLGVRLPKAVTTSHALSAGSVVKVTTVDDKIVIEIQRQTPLTLKERVNLITADNVHPEIDWGSPRGNELW